MAINITLTEEQRILLLGDSGDDSISRLLGNVMSNANLNLSFTARIPILEWV